MHDPTPIITALQWCIPINFIIAIIHWRLNNLGFSKFCAINGLACTLIMIGLKHYV